MSVCLALFVFIEINCNTLSANGYVSGIAVLSQRSNSYTSGKLQMKINGDKRLLGLTYKSLV